MKKGKSEARKEGLQVKNTFINEISNISNIINLSQYLKRRTK